MTDMAMLVTQAKARMQFLDELEALAHNPETREAEMHKGLSATYGSWAQLTPSSAPTRGPNEPWRTRWTASTRVPRLSSALTCC